MVDLQLSQNKKGQNIFQLHRFLNTFSQLPAVKKNSKNGAAGNFFGPSYFDPALKTHFNPFAFTGGYSKLPPKHQINILCPISTIHDNRI